MKVTSGLGVVVAALLTLGAPLLQAADTPHAFGQPAMQARYDALLAELRCLVCQNQSLADSHADLAQDLRDQVYRLLGEGADDDAVREYMVSRYGDFVLYEPPLHARTAVLWGGPLLLCLVALAVVWRLGRRASPPAPPLDAAERARLDALIDQHGDSQG